MPREIRIVYYCREQPQPQLDMEMVEDTFHEHEPAPDPAMEVVVEADAT